MLGYLINWAHEWTNRALALVKLCQNREVGRMTLDRKSREFKREQQPLWKKVKMLFLFNRLTEWIDQTHLLRLWTHEKNLYAGEPSIEASNHAGVFFETDPFSQLPVQAGLKEGRALSVRSPTSLTSITLICPSSNHPIYQSTQRSKTSLFENMLPGADLSTKRTTQQRP